MDRETGRHNEATVDAARMLLKQQIRKQNGPAAGQLRASAAEGLGIEPGDTGEPAEPDRVE